MHICSAVLWSVVSCCAVFWCCAVTRGAGTGCQLASALSNSTAGVVELLCSTLLLIGLWTCTEKQGESLVQLCGVRLCFLLSCRIYATALI
jgi:hypothetical protein